MTASIYATPLIRRASLEYAEPVEITDLVLSASNIRSAFDKNDWESGVLNLDKLSLNIIDDGELLNRVFWRAGMQHALIEVLWNGSSIFVGTVNERGFERDINARTAKVNILSVLETAKRDLISPGRLVNGMTAREAINALFLDTSFLSLGAVFERDLFLTVPLIGDADWFLGRTVFEGLDEITKAANLALYVRVLNGELVVDTIDISESDTVTPIEIRDPIGKLMVDSGVNRIKNQIEISIGDERYINSHLESTLSYGISKESFDFDWMDTRSARTVLNLLLNAKSLPKRVLKCGTNNFAPYLFQPVNFQQVQEYEGNPPTFPIPFGVDFAKATNVGMSFFGKVLRYTFKVMTGECQMELQSYNLAEYQG